MKLTITKPATFREPARSGTLAEISNPGTCGWRADVDAEGGLQLALALPGRNGHSYTLAGTLADWCQLVMKMHSLAETAQAAGLGPRVEPEDRLEAGVLTSLFADPHAACARATDPSDPTPDLSAGVRADMQASALDCFRCANVLPEHAASAVDLVLGLLVTRYGFTHNQVEAYGADAVAAARAQWEKEGPAAAAAERSPA